MLSHLIVCPGRCFLVVSWLSISRETIMLLRCTHSFHWDRCVFPLRSLISDALRTNQLLRLSQYPSNTLILDCVTTRYACVNGRTPESSLLGHACTYAIPGWSERDKISYDRPLLLPLSHSFPTHYVRARLAHSFCSVNFLAWSAMMEVWLGWDGVLCYLFTSSLLNKGLCCQTDGADWEFNALRFLMDWGWLLGL